MNQSVPKRVLVVEDDEEIREHLEELLEEEGFAVATASDGYQALTWLRDHPEQAGVVLLDLMMPVMDGFEFLRRKDKEPSLASVPVIVITAAGPIVEGTLRKNHRVYACLSKPLNLDRLLDTVGACCPTSAEQVNQRSAGRSR